MKIETLVIMANQIGDFFRSYPDVEQAKHDIANHLKRFWALGMREQIVAHVKDNNAEGLHKLVGDAIRENTALLA